MNNGCKQGYLLNSLEFFKQNGYVEKKCFDSVTDGKEICPSEQELEKCKRHKLSHYCVLQGLDKIKKEIYSNGPVLGLIHPYREFMTYHKGVFDFHSNPLLNGY